MGDREALAATAKSGVECAKSNGMDLQHNDPGLCCDAYPLSLMDWPADWSVHTVASQGPPSYCFFSNS